MKLKNLVPLAIVALVSITSAEASPLMSFMNQHSKIVFQERTPSRSMAYPCTITIDTKKNRVSVFTTTQVDISRSKIQLIDQNDDRVYILTKHLLVKVTESYGRISATVLTADNQLATLCTGPLLKAL